MQDSERFAEIAQIVADMTAWREANDPRYLQHFEGAIAKIASHYQAMGLPFDANKMRERLKGKKKDEYK